MKKYGEFYIPDRMMGALTRYLEQGILSSDFLTAVLVNDLMQAVALADDENLRNLPAYALFLYNEAPGISHGSKEAVMAWIKSF
jgi:hypothetical protein